MANRALIVVLLSLSCGSDGRRVSRELQIRRASQEQQIRKSLLEHQENMTVMPQLKSQSEVDIERPSRLKTLGVLGVLGMAHMAQAFEMGAVHNPGVAMMGSRFGVGHSLVNNRGRWRPAVLMNQDPAHTNGIIDSRLRNLSDLDYGIPQPMFVPQWNPAADYGIPQPTYLAVPQFSRLELEQIQQMFVEKVVQHLLAVDDSSELNIVVGNIIYILPDQELKTFAVRALKGMSDEEGKTFIEALSEPGGPLQGLGGMLKMMRKSAILRVVMPFLKKMNPNKLKVIIQRFSTSLPTEKRKEWGKEILAMLDLADLQAVADICGVFMSKK